MAHFPINQSSQIFLELAKKFGAAPLTKHDQIVAFFDDLQTRLEGLVIVDFLDMTNWDRVESHSLNRESGILTLIWHDFRGKLETEEDQEMRRLVFPASVYACALHVNSIVPLAGQKMALFAINGYAKTEKEIRKLYGSGADEILVKAERFFETRVIRREGPHIEVIDFHCTPIFSLAIVPKLSGFGSHHSKHVLYKHNLVGALTRLKAAALALDAFDPADHDPIAEKVNTVRRIMEFVLKVECCARDLSLNKSYSHILLGDLIALVKQGKEEPFQQLLAKLAEFANEFSHDSGKPVDLTKAKLVAQLALAYTTMVNINLKL